MDLAETDSNRQALTTQGVLVRQHYKVIREEVDPFRSLTTIKQLGNKP